MSVFILQEHVSARAGEHGYSYYQLIGVFATKEKAEAARDRRIKGQPYWKPYYPIEEWEVR